MSELLVLEGVHAHYGHIEALKGIDLVVNRGEIVTLIGANGAGKSTLLMTVCGKPPATRGRIRFDGDDITRRPTYEIVRRGIAQAPEGRRIFPRMSVLENLQMGATTADPRHFAEDVERVYALFPVLRERHAQRGGTLSGGEQQMLAIGRALMARPRLLLLDEPSLGLAPLVIRQIFRVVREINAQGTTVLLVEQDAFHGLKIARRAYVMAAGRMVLSGTGEELLANPEVRAAYLEGGRREVEPSRSSPIA
jgi:branched-chain amino acid transport system ATP-binding protein